RVVHTKGDTLVVTKKQKPDEQSARAVKQEDADPDVVCRDCCVRGHSWERCSRNPARKYPPTTDKARSHWDTGPAPWAQPEDIEHVRQTYGFIGAPGTGNDTRAAVARSSTSASAASSSSNAEVRAVRLGRRGQRDIYFIAD